MRRFADGFYETGGPAGDLVAKWSPDGRRFVVEVRKGNVETNTNDYSLLLFDATNLSSTKAHAETLVTMSSSSNRSGLDNVKWIDNNTIAFLGERPGEKRQLYAVNCTSRKLTQLLTWPSDIAAYDVTSDLQQLIFVASSPLSNSSGDQAGRTGIVVSEQRIEQLLNLMKDVPGDRIGGQQLFIKTRSGRISPLQSKEPISQEGYPTDWWQLSFSPDGRYAIVQTKMFDIPISWTKYTNAPLKRLMQLQVGNPDASKPVYRYLLIDIGAGTVEPLLDSPNAYGHLSQYTWRPNGSSVFVSQVFLPLNSVNSRELNQRKEMPFVAEVRIPSHEVIPITDKELSVIRWDKVTDELLLRADTHESAKNEPLVRYRKSASEWQEVRSSPGDAPAGQPFRVLLEEDLNTPPRIVAENVKTGQRTLLLDLNPQFKELEFAHVEIVKWEGTDGHEAEGGLYLPINYVSGKRYPLVIQTHAWNPNKFWIDGPWPTAYAAQPLAGKGFIVLQVGDPGPPLSPNLGPAAVARYEGAVNYLDGRGLIDRERVGLIGFSASGYELLYTITHSKYNFAAADNTDAGGGGYFFYLLSANAQNAFLDVYELQNGGRPFGVGLTSWLANSPGFNLDKVRTPLRIEPLSPASLLSNWEEFAGLKRLGKPVEMIFIPDGVHMLQKPWHRMISMQGNVDWFSFWLKGEEDPDPDKAEQYKRWRQLTKLQEENDAKDKAAEEKAATPVN